MRYKITIIALEIEEGAEFGEEYDNMIEEQRKNGIVEIVPESKEETLEETEVTLKRIHYSPHHAVVRRGRKQQRFRLFTTDLQRTVRTNDLSMIVYKIPHVFEMLTNFRWNSGARTADIEKAFLMVGIKPEDRDMLRFL